MTRREFLATTAIALAPRAERLTLDTAASGPEGDSCVVPTFRLTRRAGLKPGTTRQDAARRSRLILLGTGGGPSPKRTRSSPSQVILVGDAAYVVDCGDGVSRQLVLADVSLTDVRAVFITHQHSDHNADYGNLLLFAWVGGLHIPVDAYGPPPLGRMTKLFLDMNDYDIQIRMKDEGRTPLAPLIQAHEITAPGVIRQDDLLKVTAALNHHPPVSPSFTYRFDTPDRSIVISGDTTVSDNLIKLAAGADVLVHEVMYVPRIDALVKNFPAASRLKQHLIDSHTSTEDVGRVAAAADVKTLVLSHFVPGGDETISDDMWVEGVRRHFRGRIVVGKDLLEI